MGKKQKTEKKAKKKMNKNRMQCILRKSVVGTTFGVAVVSCTSLKDMENRIQTGQEPYVLSVKAEKETDDIHLEGEALLETEPLSNAEDESYDSDRESELDEKDVGKLSQTETEKNLDIEIQTQLKTELKQETQLQSETEEEQESETKNDRESEVQLEPETEKIQDLEGQSESEAGKTQELEGQSESEAKKTQELEGQSESETEKEQQKSEIQSELETDQEIEKQSESETEKEQESEIRSEKETEIQTEIRTELQSESLSDSEQETEEKSEAELESGLLTVTRRDEESELQSEREQVSEPQPESDSKISSETEVSPENQIEIESEQERESESRSEKQSEIETEAESKLQADPESEQELESQPESESERKPEIEKELEPELESEKQPDIETGEESESQADSESERELMTQPETASESEIQLEIETELESETQFGRDNGKKLESKKEMMTEAGQEITEKQEIKKKEIKNEKNSNDESGEDNREETVCTETELNEITQETENFGGESDKDTQRTMDTKNEDKSEKTLMTADAQNEAVRGQHYEIRGENYAWYRDDNDRLWIRKDSAVVIEPSETGGYNRKIMTQGLAENGSVRFHLEQVDDSGQVLNRSASVTEEYYVDGDVPRADISVEGEWNKDRIFCQEGKIAIVVPPDAESGLKQTAYCIIPADEEQENIIQMSESEWTHCNELDLVTWDQEGSYCVYVRTEDQVGNVAFNKSGVFCVDHTPPDVSIDGIHDKTANSGKVNIQVKCRDKNGGQKLCSAQIRGLNNGIVIQPGEIVENEEEIRFSFDDLPKEKQYDDIYEMTVKVQDLAGNVSEEKVQFSVNRCGSVYHLDETTEEYLDQYYLQNSFDLVIYETNVDYVGESRVFCRRDGILQELVKDSDYQVSMTGTEKTWKQYQYTIPAQLLEKEGIYEILLVSRDSADHITDTSVQEHKISFAIDQTSPTYLLSGIKEKQIFEAKKAKVHLQASDNVCLKKVKIYKDSVLWKEYTGAQWNDKEEKVIIDLEEKDMWQTLQVYLEDASGNTCWSREIPFYLSSSVREQDVPVYRKLKSSAEELEKHGGKEYLNVKEASFSGKESKSTSGGQKLFWTGVLSLLLVLGQTVCTRLKYRFAYIRNRRKR